MSEHTPGPWEARPRGKYKPLRVVQAEDDGPGEVRIAECGQSRPADAHLIAAAPELLEALVELHGEVMAYQPELLESDEWGPVLRSARAAIDKATDSEGQP